MSAKDGPKGKERKGKERKGKERKGKERNGKQNKVKIGKTIYSDKMTKSGDEK